jgi:hypothetical protein
MAKALLGHVGAGNDARLLAEVQRLRRRVRDLEDELARSRAIQDLLVDPSSPVVLAEAASSAELHEELREPALA